MMIDAVVDIAARMDGNVVVKLSGDEAGPDDGILFAAIGARDGRDQLVLDTLNSASLAPVQEGTGVDLPSFPKANIESLTLYALHDEYIIVNASGVANVAALDSALEKLTDAFAEE